MKSKPNKSQFKIIDPRTRASFRHWLMKNYSQPESVWVTVYKLGSNPNWLRYNDLVEECLCFGWIDSLPRKNNEESYFLLISQRKPKSVWSAVNKKKIATLIKNGQMTDFGLEKIRLAKTNGSWKALNNSDRLVLPKELKNLLSQNKTALDQFNNFSKSARRGLLEWIYSAKTPATKQTRIAKTITMAAQGLKANVLKKAKP